MAKDVDSIFGMPTRVEVAEIERAYPTLERGQDILYDEIAEIIGKPHGHPRFHSVTDAWRKKVRREKNLIIECIPKLGFHVMTAAEQVDSGVSDFGKGVRVIRRGFGKVADTPPEQLSGPSRAKQEHSQRIMSHMLDGLQRSRRELTKPPLAIEPTSAVVPTAVGNKSSA
jgi:hypothetical protein